MRKNVLLVFSIFSFSFLLFSSLETTVYGDERLQEKADIETLVESDNSNYELFEQTEVINIAEKDSRTHPKTRNGQRARYNTRYYLTDKNLPSRGGATYSVWMSYDYVLFDHNPSYRGIPIIFESMREKQGFIESNDEIIIRSTDGNWAGRVYWHYTDRLSNPGVHLTNQRYIFGNIYGSTSDTSVGLSMTGAATVPGTPFSAPYFGEFRGDTNGTPWLRARTTYLNNISDVPPVTSRMTSFYLEAVPFDGTVSVNPVANSYLFVNSNMTLAAPGNNNTSDTFNFSYVQSENAYLISYGSTSNRLRWNGGAGLGNIHLGSSPGHLSGHYYWIIDTVDNGYVIRNKQDPTMVWDIHNFQSTVGGRIKLEKEHPPTSPQRDAQLFNLNQR